MKPFRSLLLQSLLLVSCLSVSLFSYAEKITVAAAAQLKFAMDEIVNNFNQSQPDHEVSVVYSASGKLLAQIQQGAPYDLFFSADMDFPLELVKSEFAASAVKHYASGRIVLWSATYDATDMTLASLLDPKILRVAIANPKHAPYGMRAAEALHASGLWEKVEPKLVYGESIAQATQFVQTENAQVGIIALALALDSQLTKQGGYWLIPADLHQPLEQGFVITKRAADSALAKTFADYIFSEPAREVLTRYGYELPELAEN